MRILPRSAWGAELPAGRFMRHRIERVTVHESGHLVRDESDTVANLRAYQTDHQARGWPDLAYHFAIGPEGRVYRGRTVSAVGDTATPYDPAGHLLVMCDGAFRWQHPSDATVDALVDLLAWACDRYGVGAPSIAAHRDLASIACPGARLYRFFTDGSIQRRVAQRLRADRPTPRGPIASA